MKIPATRALSSEEEIHIDRTLARLRAHFHQWSYIESPHELVDFAFYEGCGSTECCGASLSLAAPLALGMELVQKHDFKWVMVRFENGWDYAVMHVKKGLLVDLEALEDGQWLTEEIGFESAGQRTHDFYESIVERING
jgi:hypothetical protein